MTKLSSEFCLKIKEARRAAGLSQSVLAAEVGCKQSAISMFERGDGTKLSDETVGKLAKRFGISLTEKVAVEPRAVPTEFAPAAVIRVHGFCPNVRCPSNQIYEVDGRTLALPNREKADPIGGKFCALCGEVLEKQCPNCGAPLHDGAVCSLCGDPYVVLS